ncbi:SEC-C metal-binding domain-containing protein, partial [Escherichia coli]|nr:SEC-C domain-containing protein [Escherichia coli]
MSRRRARPNEPCPCGSGIKFKRCCGRPAGAAKPAGLHYSAAERAS